MKSEFFFCFNGVQLEFKQDELRRSCNEDNVENITCISWC